MGNKKELTAGQKRVGIVFNSKEKPEAKKIKEVSAQQIDYIESLNADGDSSEIARLRAGAQDLIERGCEMAIRSLF